MEVPVHERGCSDIEILEQPSRGRKQPAPRPVFGPLEPAADVVPDPAEGRPGGLAYAKIYLMALTSNDASQRALGKGWKWLHRIGIHYIWLIFAISYLSRAIHADPTYHVEGRLLAPLFLAALVLRLYAWRRR